MTNNPENMPETYHIQKLKAVSVQLSAIGRAGLAFTVLTNAEHLQSIIQNTRANDTLAEENKRLREALEGMIEVGEAYQSIIWNDDHEGDNYDGTIEYAIETLNQTKGS